MYDGIRVLYRHTRVCMWTIVAVFYTHLHLKLLSPNEARARVHYIEFKVLEKITETLSMAEGIL